MCDFRLPRVLTRHGTEGDYIVVDMEYAGPDCIKWSLNPLDKWDADTLNEVSVRPCCYYSRCKPALLQCRPLALAVLAT